MSETNENLIVVRQLPIIEDQLRRIKTDVEQRVGLALSLACTEETRQSVKAARADLSREFNELEARRKEVKAAIMAPYEEFERLYKECAADIYRDADTQLKARIDDVENGLKKQKADRAMVYFDEYRRSLGLDDGFVSFASVGVKVTLTSSDKSLKDAIRSFLDRVADDLSAIDTQEHSAEILVEYKRDFNLSRSIALVASRHKAIEAERARMKAAAEQAAAVEESVKQIEAVATPEPVMMPPTVVDAPEEEPASAPQVEPTATIYSTAFKVRGTLDKLRALKQFLIEGGYEYEQL